MDNKLDLSDSDQKVAIVTELSKELTNSCFNKCYSFMKNPITDKTIVFEKGVNCMETCNKLYMTNFMNTFGAMIKLVDKTDK